MESLIKTNSEYKSWIIDIKQRIYQSRIKAAISVNNELIKLYWSLGKDIIVLKAETKWGNGVMAHLSKDLMNEFPEMKGFSETNLRYCKRFYLFYSQDVINQPQVGADLTEFQDIEFQPQVGAKLENIFKIPWGHHKHIISRCKSINEAMFYIGKTMEQGWSRSVLMNYMEADLYTAEGKAISNFAAVLPKPQSDLAQQTLKDPYVFDFLTMRTDYMERELEVALTDNITKFLIELGSGFAYVGRQVRIEVGESEFFMDLLFYHLKLRCYVVIELKTGEFMAEYVSKLGLYVSAVNHQLRHADDKPSIGLLICKSKDEVVAKYTLENSKQPIGVSEYQLKKLFQKEFESALPSIEEIENELK
jgi:predicted nuclease of restriction endonuclease-like (RecB) superfamily